MNHCPQFKTYLLIWMFSLLFPIQAAAATPLTQPPVGLSEAIDNMLAFADSDGDSALDTDLIPRILDFIDTPKQLGESFPLVDRSEEASDYYEFTINRSFDEVIELVYHPELPSFLTIPSSVRRSHWVSVNGKSQVPPALRPDRIDPQNPLIIKGLEFIENSPDTYSGAYYAYNLQRALILTMYQGRRVLISISSQADKSQVGKKGVVLGDDREWNYLYTGETGTTLPGMGWADTYIYGSDAIMIYYETGGGREQVKCGVFKWINAGLWGMNFAQPENVRKGVERFATDFRAIIESPKLTDVTRIVQMFKGISDLSLNDLRTMSSDYFDHIQQRYRDDSPKYEKWFVKLFKDRTYLESLSREEMQALVSIEYLKYLMGKPHNLDMGRFATSVAKRKPS